MITKLGFDTIYGFQEQTLQYGDLQSKYSIRMRNKINVLANNKSLFTGFEEVASVAEEVAYWTNKLKVVGSLPQNAHKNLQPFSLL